MVPEPEEAQDDVSGLVIRRYQEGDESDIVSLLQATLINPHLYTEDYWRWMYRLNPLKSAMICLAVDAGRLVGHYALVPFRMNVNGVVRTGATAVNIAVHPDYQGRGIFARLVAEGVEWANSEGIALSYVFPNEKSAPIFTRRLGWVKVGSLRLLVKPFDLESLLRRRFGSRVLARVMAIPGRQFLHIFFREHESALPEDTIIRQVVSFDERMDGFWEKAVEGHHITTVRDTAYLTWRFVDKPVENDYEIFLAESGQEILGYIVLKWMTSWEEKAGTVMDLLTLPGRDDIAGCLIARAIQRCRETGSEALHYHISSTSSYYRCFRRSGFISFGEGVTRLVAQANSAELPLEFISNPANWHITVGGGNWL